MTWTRSHWEAAADRLLEGVAPYQSPDGARFYLPGPRDAASGRRADGMEGFARTFWLAACRMKHAPQARQRELADRYLRGLISGVSDDDAAWPRGLEVAQAMAETTSIAFGLYESREFTWDRLDPSQQDRLASRLLDNVSRTDANGNWLHFRILTHAVLRSLGHPVDIAQTFADLDRIEACYRGGGWYSDGGDASSTKFDYYNAWCMHLYPLLWARIEGDRLDPARTARYRERAALHFETLLHLIGADGAPVFQGRSLIYRGALTTAFWAAALADVPGVDLGAGRRAAGLVMEHFEPSWSSGILPLGWFDEFLPMVQPYSGPSSPYWFSKAFVGLLLPPEHPAWVEPEHPLPIEVVDFVRVESEPGWLLVGRAGSVRLLNGGTSRSVEDRDPFSRALADDPHYNRVAYSSVTFPTYGAAIADNALVLTADDGTADQRLGLRVTDSGPDWLGSTFDLEGSREWTVESLLVVDGAVELRAFRVVSEFVGAITISGYSRPEGSWLEPLAPAVVATSDGGATPLSDGSIVPYARYDDASSGHWYGVLVALDDAPADAVARLTDRFAELVA